MKKLSADKYAAAIRTEVKSYDVLIERRRTLKQECEATKQAIQEAETALANFPAMPRIERTQGDVPTAEEIDHIVADHNQKRLDLEQALASSKMRLRLLGDAQNSVSGGINTAAEKIKAARIAYAKAVESHTLSTQDVERFSTALRRLGAFYQVAYNAPLLDEWYVNLLKVTPTDEDLANACRELEVDYG